VCVPAPPGVFFTGTVQYRKRDTGGAGTQCRYSRNLNSRDVIRPQPYTCLGIERLTQGAKGEWSSLCFMFIRPQPYTCLGIES